MTAEGCPMRRPPIVVVGPRLALAALVLIFISCRSGKLSAPSDVVRAPTISAQDPAPRDSAAPPDLASPSDSAAPPILADDVTRTSPSGMALIEGGRFWMNLRAMKAVVTDFCLDKMETSAAQYRACVQAGTCTADGLICGPEATYSTPSTADHPVNCVDGVQAAAFCNARGGRLPTEMEWEWAARGEKRGFEHPWGDSPPQSQLCWSGFARRTGTCPVGSFPSGTSPDGISDLAGNVTEWTATSYPALHSRIVRGGSWQDTQPIAADVGMFFAWPDWAHIETLGFRCAASVSRGKSG